MENHYLIQSADVSSSPTSKIRFLPSIATSCAFAALLQAGAAFAQKASPTTVESEGKKAAPEVPPQSPSASPEAIPSSSTPSAQIPGDARSSVEPGKARKKNRTVESAGLSTQSLTLGSPGEISEATDSEKGWTFRFKGCFRGPMRLGIDNSGSLTPGKLQFHAPPVVPDGNFTRWAFTNNNPGPWAELLFQYGNQRVTMTTTIASYNITAGGWRELQAQQGIDRAFLTLKFPEALGTLGGMAWDVGVFSNFYGAMGKYSGGIYETYLIGRTRIAGATATVDMELPNDWRLVLEAGGGAMMDQQPQNYNNGTMTTYYPSWQPFPGSRQIGTTLLVHGHAGLVMNDIWTLNAHYINTFARDARWNVASQGGTTSPTPTPDASIQVAGLDLKLNGGWMGDGYLGYSYLKAKYADVIGGSIELLQSQGGWQLAQNYFPDGKGSIHSIGFQYTFSLESFLTRPRPFFGQSADLTITPFLMVNKVTNTTNGQFDMTKVKGGADIIYSFHPIVSAGIRYDLVQPNMNDSGQSFQVFTSKLIFRSQFVTHEMITLQYSYYRYGSSYTDPTKSESVMPWPFGQYGNLNTAKYGNGSPPDKHVVTIAAFMAW
jgi:hypothetical protein